MLEWAQTAGGPPFSCEGLLSHDVVEVVHGHYFVVVGVGTLDHLVEGVTEGHASAVLAASIFHFGQHSIAEAHDALRAAGLPVRV